MKSGWVVRPGAAEFPHENELVDRGALWIGSALCGVETVVAVRKPKTRTFARIQALAPPMRTELILPPPLPPVAPDESAPIACLAEPVETRGPRAEPVGAPTEREERAEAVETRIEPTNRAEPDAPRDERVETFVRAISEVARAHGPAETAAHVESLFKFGTPAPLDLDPSARAALLDGNILEAIDGGVHATAWFTRTSSAWQSMLRGDGGNLAECGESTLDDWTANLIALLVAKPGMASTIRRDLRRRGIAAFGMLDS